jgi:hypothetical protein
MDPVIVNACVASLDLTIDREKQRVGRRRGCLAKRADAGERRVDAVEEVGLLAGASTRSEDVCNTRPTARARAEAAAALRARESPRRAIVW